MKSLNVSIYQQAKDMVGLFGLMVEKEYGTRDPAGTFNAFSSLASFALSQCAKMTKPGGTEDSDAHVFRVAALRVVEIYAMTLVIEREKRKGAEIDPDPTPDQLHEIDRVTRHLVTALYKRVTGHEPVTVSAKMYKQGIDATAQLNDIVRAHNGGTSNG